MYSTFMPVFTNKRVPPNLNSHSSHTGLSVQPTSSSPWFVSSPQRAWWAVVEPVGWFAWLRPSSVAYLVASLLPSSRRPWRSMRSWTCGRSTRPAPASPSSEQTGTCLHALCVSATWGGSLLWVFYWLAVGLFIFPPPAFCNTSNRTWTFFKQEFLLLEIHRFLCLRFLFTSKSLVNMCQNFVLCCYLQFRALNFQLKLSISVHFIHCNAN